MKKIKIIKVNQQIFKIINCERLSNRELMKLSIFLSSIMLTFTIETDNTFTIVHDIKEKYSVVKILGKIINYLEKRYGTVDFDDKIIEMLESVSKHETDFDATRARLLSIKRDNFQNSKDFETFRHFCDNNLQIRLRDYQYTSAYTLYIGKGGFDFSVPGAGKTIITYTTYSCLKANSFIKKILIIGPISSYNAWFDEYITCFGQSPEFQNLADESIDYCKIYLSTSPKNHSEVTFINTDKIRLLTAEIIGFMTKENTLLVIDEAHKIKNPDAAITQSVLEITKYASMRILLTGTPMPNGYEDLFSLVKTFAPFDEILPFNFRQLYLLSKNAPTPSQKEKIRECIAPYYSRVSKKYLLKTNELLPPFFHEIHCDMNDEQYSLYERLNKFCGKIKDDLDEDFLFNFKKAILIRKMQISANPALLNKSIMKSMDELNEEYKNSIDNVNSKIGSLIKADKELMDEFNESYIARIVNKYDKGEYITSKNLKALELTKSIVASGRKVLVWDIFVKNMDALKRLFENKIECEIELINGSITGNDRQSALKRFREKDSMVLIANPATLAESISLHRTCQDAIFVNRNFNAAQYIQSKDRIHRINMPEGTKANYYFILNNGSVDLSVDEILKKKEERMLSILDAEDIEIGGSEMDDSNIMSLQDIEESYVK